MFSKLQEFVRNRPKEIGSFINPYSILSSKEYNKQASFLHASQLALSNKTHSRITHFLKHPPQIKSPLVPLITNPIRKTKYLSPISNADFCYEWNRSNVSGLEDKRLLHSIKAMQNLKVLASNSKEYAFEYFFNLISNKNKVFEDQKKYRENIAYLQNIVNRLNSEQFELVKAGILLHDCGYLLDSGDSHPNASYQMLANPAIQEALHLDFDVNNGYDILAMMGGYHGIISDSYPLSKIREILSVYNQPFDMRALAIIAALDSSAKIFPKPVKNEICFHSMMFSRTLELIPAIFGCDLTKSDQSIVFFGSGFPASQLNELGNSRLRAIFSHSNYSFISLKSYVKLLTLVLSDELCIDPSYNYLLDNVSFKCWLFMKDFISSEPVHETGYFIDRISYSEYAFNKQYLFDFYLFLVILTKIIDRIAFNQQIEDYDFEIDMESELKQAYMKDITAKKNILDNIHSVLQQYCNKNGDKIELIEDKNDFILKGNTNDLIFTIHNNGPEKSKFIRITFGVGTPASAKIYKTIEFNINSYREDMPWYDEEEKDINQIPSKIIPTKNY